VQSTKRCCASTRVCSENRKQDTNVLDGADFVRDVLDTYLEVNVHSPTPANLHVVILHVAPYKTPCPSGLPL